MLRFLFLIIAMVALAFAYYTYRSWRRKRALQAAVGDNSETDTETDTDTDTESEAEAEADTMLKADLDVCEEAAVEEEVAGPRKPVLTLLVLLVTYGPYRTALNVARDYVKLASDPGRVRVCHSHFEKGSKRRRSNTWRAMRDQMPPNSSIHVSDAAKFTGRVRVLAKLLDNSYRDEDAICTVSPTACPTKGWDAAAVALLGKHDVVTACLTGGAHPQFCPLRCESVCLACTGGAPCENCSRIYGGRWWPKTNVGTCHTEPQPAAALSTDFLLYRSEVLQYATFPEFHTFAPDIGEFFMFSLLIQAGIETIVPAADEALNMFRCVETDVRKPMHVTLCLPTPSAEVRKEVAEDVRTMRDWIQQNDLWGALSSACQTQVPCDNTVSVQQQGVWY